MTRSKTYAKAFHGHKFGGVMAVDQKEADLEDEELEFQNRGGALAGKMVVVCTVETTGTKDPAGSIFVFPIFVTDS